VSELETAGNKDKSEQTYRFINPFMPDLNAPLSSAADWNFCGGCISGATHTG